jgi:hypothetical protein
VATDTGVPAIEQRQVDGTNNGGKILFTAVQNGAGIYVVVIYDADSNEGGGRGRATVTATCNGTTCPNTSVAAAVDANLISNGFPIALSWVPCCEDGFVLGPFSASATNTVCFQHSSLNAVGSARFVTGGANRVYHSITSDASAGEICIIV